MKRRGYGTKPYILLIFAASACVWKMRKCSIWAHTNLVRHGIDMTLGWYFINILVTRCTICYIMSISYTSYFSLFQFFFSFWHLACKYRNSHTNIHIDTYRINDKRIDIYTDWNLDNVNIWNKLDIILIEACDIYILANLSYSESMGPPIDLGLKKLLLDVFYIWIPL